MIGFTHLLLWMGLRKNFGTGWKGKILDGCMGSVVRPKSNRCFLLIGGLLEGYKVGGGKSEDQECEDILVRSLFRGYVFGTSGGVSL